MKLSRNVALRILGALCLALSILPARALAQAGGRAVGGGVAGGTVGVQQIRQVIQQLDLTTEQKTKIRDIMQKAQQDLREAMQGIQDATPEERQAKMQDLTKLVADTREKVEAELTPEQKAKYFPLMAQAGLKQATDLLASLKTASGKMEIAEDLKKQLNNIFDDSQKTLDNLKTDADAVKDAAGQSDFTKQIGKFQLDLRKQIVDVLGQEDGQKLMQSARQSMRPAGGGGGTQLAARRRATTGPADK